MNNEMMPLFGFILQSEDLKKQSEKIIQEVRVSNDAKKFADEFISNISNSEIIKANLKFQEEQRQILLDIKASVNSLHQKIDTIINSNSSSAGSSVYSSEKEDKKTGKK